MSRLAERLQQDINDGKVQSIRAIARRAGVSDSTIRSIMSGITPRAPTLNKLADNYFKLPRLEVYRMTGEHLPNGRIHDPDRDWLLERLYDMLSRMPTKALTEFLEVVMRKAAEYREID